MREQYNGIGGKQGMEKTTMGSRTGIYKREQVVLNSIVGGINQRMITHTCIHIYHLKLRKGTIEVGKNTQHLYNYALLLSCTVN